MLEGYIKEPISRFPEDPSSFSHESAEEAGVRLASACCVIYLTCHYSLKYEHTDTDRILSALLLRVDKESRHCLDYDQLISVYFPSQAWRRLALHHLQSWLYSSALLLNWLSRVSNSLILPLSMNHSTLI